MEKRRRIQYTIRDVSDRMDAVLRERSAKYGKSLNETALEALSKGLGLGDEPVRHHDMDDLFGKWVDDPEFDKAIAEMRRIDPDMWK